MFEKTLKYIIEARQRENLLILLTKRKLKGNIDDDYYILLEDKLNIYEARLVELDSIIEHFENSRKK